MTIDLKGFLDLAMSVDSAAMLQILDGLECMVFDASKDLKHPLTKPSQKAELLQYRANLQAYADAILLAHSKMEIED